jgi:hypothetical protein
MVREIMKTRCHILFDEAALKEWSISAELFKQAPDPELLTRETSDFTLYIPQVTPTPPKTPDMSIALGSAGPEAGMPESLDADALNAVQSIGDQLKRNVFWWVIEIIPTNYMWQNEQDEWVRRWR